MPGKQFKCVIYYGQTSEAARENGCEYVIRGIRSKDDAEYEMLVARTIGSQGVKTLFFYPSSDELVKICSTQVRERIIKKESIQDMVPVEVIRLLS